MSIENSTHLFALEADVVAAPVALHTVRHNPSEHHEHEDQAHEARRLEERLDGRGLRGHLIEAGPARPRPLAVAVDQRTLRKIVRYVALVVRHVSKFTSRR